MNLGVGEQGWDGEERVSRTEELFFKHIYRGYYHKKFADQLFSVSSKDRSQGLGLKLLLQI